MLNFLQDLQFSEHISNLIPFNALLFIHVLHGIHLLCISLLYNAHLDVTKKRERTWHLDSYVSISLVSQLLQHCGSTKAIFMVTEDMVAPDHVACLSKPGMCS